MTLEQLVELDAQIRQRKPKLFQLSTHDEPASDDQIAAVETTLQVELPSSYREFLKRFGGGEFGLTTIFSADPQSAWFLPTRQADASRYLPSGLLAFSDDFAGGLYVFQITPTATRDEVLYWNRDGGLTSTRFQNLLEYVANHAYFS